MLLVSIVVSMEINRWRYFRSGPRILHISASSFVNHQVYINTKYITKEDNFKHIQNLMSASIISPNIFCIYIYLTRFNRPEHAAQTHIIAFKNPVTGGILLFLVSKKNSSSYCKCANYTKLNI